MGQFTDQEIFNKIWERAKDPRICGRSRIACYYRPQDELPADTPPCFIGILIPDDLVDECGNSGSIEGNISYSEWSSFFKGNNVHFLNICQRVHDNRHPDQWQKELRIIAHEYNLTVPE